MKNYTPKQEPIVQGVWRKMKERAGESEKGADENDEDVQVNW